MAGLKDKRLLFVDEYLIDLNATQAAIRAGYSAATAYSQGQRLLKNVDVTTAIQAGFSDRSKRTSITADYVLESICSTIERCKQVEAVLDRKGDPMFVFTADGELAPAYTFNAAAVLKGSELLGRHLGLFDDKLRLSGDVQIHIHKP